MRLFSSQRFYIRSFDYGFAGNCYELVGHLLYLINAETFRLEKLGELFPKIRGTISRHKEGFVIGGKGLLHQSPSSWPSRRCLFWQTRDGHAEEKIRRGREKEGRELSVPPIPMWNCQELSRNFP